MPTRTQRFDVEVPADIWIPNQDEYITPPSRKGGILGRFRSTPRKNFKFSLKAFVEKVVNAMGLGSSEATTASNGLTEVVNDVQLGGDLTANTTIDGLNTYELTLDNLTSYYLTGDNLYSTATNELQLISTQGQIDIYTGTPGQDVLIYSSGELDLSAAANVDINAGTAATINSVDPTVITVADGISKTSISTFSDDSTYLNSQEAGGGRGYTYIGGATVGGSVESRAYLDSADPTKFSGIRVGTDGPNEHVTLNILGQNTTETLTLKDNVGLDVIASAVNISTSDFTISSSFQLLGSYTAYADDAAAAVGGVAVGQLYKNSSTNKLHVRLV